MKGRRGRVPAKTRYDLGAIFAGDRFDDECVGAGIYSPVGDFAGVFPERMSNKRITIWAENVLALYSAKPVVDRYLRRGYEVFVYTEDENVEAARKSLGLPPENVRGTGTYDSRWLRKLKTLFDALFVDPNYSEPYRRRREIASRVSRLYRFLNRLTFLNLRKPRINRAFARFMSVFYGLGLFRRVDLPSEKLISFTRVNRPYMICNRTRKHIAIMESWDHPVKEPYLINPRYCLVWNRDLGEDTRASQGVPHVGPVEPLKFRYIYERLSRPDEEILAGMTRPEYRRELRGLWDRDFLLYPTTTCSIGGYHEGEMILIDQLCRAAERENITLYIKPKPNGPKGDYDEFTKYRNVIVGLYSDKPDWTDMLDEEYQSFRYLLLKCCRAVVNVGTTFVLEAALARRPVLQLDLRSDVYGRFTVYSKTAHVTRYLLTDLAKPYHGDVSELGGLLRDIGMEYSDRLRQWIRHW